MLRSLAYAGAALVTLICADPQPAVAQQRGGTVTVATIGEPNTLDPMISAGDLLGMITQHFYETLFTFGQDWELTPQRPPRRGSTAGFPLEKAPFEMNAAFDIASPHSRSHAFLNDFQYFSRSAISFARFRMS